MTIFAYMSSALFGLLPALIFFAIAARGFPQKKAAISGEAIGFFAGFLLMYTFGRVGMGVDIDGYFGGIIVGQASIAFGLILSKKQ